MSSRRSALGRGLGALIPGAGSNSRTESATVPLSAPAENARITTDTPQAADAALRVDALQGPAILDIREIDPNPEQPRRRFDPVQLEELAGSIRRHGVLQPVVVRRAGARYELIVGERRFRASQLAGRTTIPAVVADIATRDRLDIAIIENVQRQDLNPMELAHAYRALSQSGATQEEIGERVSKDRSSIANHMRLLDLSRELQEDIEEGRLTMGHAKALLQVQNRERRHHLRNRVLSEKLSVRETELLGRQIAGPTKRAASRKPRKEPVAADPAFASELAPVIEGLQRHLQTRVRIVGGAEQGKIEIEYFEAEDLQRLVALLMSGR